MHQLARPDEAHSLLQALYKTEADLSSEMSVLEQTLRLSMRIAAYRHHN
jgi:hypothetical protein